MDSYRATLWSKVMSQKARKSGSDLEIWREAKGDEFRALFMNLIRVMSTHSNGAGGTGWI